jgi:hypothetical protein
VFGAFLGYNPVASLLGPTGILATLPHARAAYLTGRSFFPSLISAPFASGLHEAFDFAIAAMLIAAAASWLRGKPSTELESGSMPPAAAMRSAAGAGTDPAPGINGSGPTARTADRTGDDAEATR